MSRVFVDTSAIYSLLSRVDRGHGRSRATFDRLKLEEAGLVTTSYVVVETYALVDRRLGREAARRLREDFEPLLEVVWVDPELHEQGLDTFFSSSRTISLVDAVSSSCMRHFRIDRVWEIDGHFSEEGFEVEE